LGCAIAQDLLAEGWMVHGLDVLPASISHERFVSHAVDLRDALAAQEVAAACASIGVFVHAAGLLRVARLGNLSPEDFEVMWQVHVAAASAIGNHLIPRMVEQQFGRVVLIGSRVSAGVAGRSQYAATKSALNALARSWASEVVRAGVTVNVVSPAATNTGMVKQTGRSASPPELPPIGRLIERQEISSLVRYLIGSNAAAITGQNIQICGGSSLT
jgi:NAD(P)-dependent dehydrogenase (short-subunit alcohol dehydrogenase family)